MSLPTGDEIVGRLAKIKNCSKIEVEELRKWMFEKTQSIQNDITTYITNTDYKEDPDVYQERLYKFHYLMGGMSGLVVALYERAYYLAFKELTEDGRNPSSATNKKALNAGDRESYAKGEVSDIKGLRTLIEESISNLETRLYGCRSTNRKW